jgi:hypothetical protein
MTWGDKVNEDLQGGAYAVKGAKGKKAMDTYYSTNLTASGLNTKDIQNKKIAITNLLSTLPLCDIRSALSFEDPESQFIGLKDTKGKATAECLSIIFSGAYNKGVPCFTEECTLYDVVYENFEYTAVVKLDWKLYFFTIIMFHRSTKVGKSLLERFCMTNNRYVSVYLDNQLNPIVKYLGTVCRSANQIILDMREFTAPHNSIIFCADVTSLYPNIPINEGILMFKKLLEEIHPYCREHNLLLLDLLHWVLTNNYCIFQQKTYLQLKGTALGTPTATSFANLFLYGVERALVSRHKPSYCRRYIDDIFAIFYNPTR